MIFEYIQYFHNDAKNSLTETVFVCGLRLEVKKEEIYKLKIIAHKK